MLDDFQRFQVRRFLTFLPTDVGYCANCLGRLYGEAPDKIRSYLGGATAGQHAECGKCGERTETYRSRHFA
jgi:hypothetical protein